ncbi:hypothetical protein KAU34_00575, partial [candidate division WOR-3 bacterium]|nr:hypothetical protein [candidate division WOR-3 bacterium]
KKGIGKNCITFFTIWCIENNYLRRNLANAKQKKDENESDCLFHIIHNTKKCIGLNFCFGKLSKPNPEALVFKK